MTHSIELPDDVFALVEQVRRELGVSRAEVIRTAVAAQAKAAKPTPRASKPKAARPHPLDAKLRKPAVDEPMSDETREQLEASREDYKRGDVYTLEETRTMLGI